MKKGHSVLVTVFLLLSTLYFSPIVLGTEQNPAYWQVNSTHVINIYEKSDLNSRVLAIISPTAQGLKNLGCKGKIMKGKTLCKVEYREQIGWVEARYLTAYSQPPKTETENAIQDEFQLNCNKIEYATDKLICQSPPLKMLNDQLNAVFEQALTQAKSETDVVSPQEEALKAAQHHWIAQRNDCWRSTQGRENCIKNLYEQRITELQADWNIVSPVAANHFKCEDNSVFLIIEYHSTLLPSALMEFDDQRRVFIITPTASGVRYNGKEDSYVWLKGNEALFVWDTSKPLQHCQMIEPVHFERQNPQ